MLEVRSTVIEAINHCTGPRRVVDLHAPGRCLQWA